MSRRSCEYVTGGFAVGKDSSVIDLVLIGEHLDKSFIDTLVEKAEEMINRKIKYQVLTEDEMNHFYYKKPTGITDLGEEIRCH